MVANYAESDVGIAITRGSIPLFLSLSLSIVTNAIACVEFLSLDRSARSVCFIGVDIPGH